MIRAPFIILCLGLASCGSGGPDPVAAARALLDAGKQAEAKVAAEAESYRPPRTVGDRLPLARLLVEVKSPRRAVAILKDEKLTPEARDVLAWAHLRAGDRVRARREVDRQIEAGTESALTKRVLGELLLLERRPREARTALKEALGRDDGDPVTYVLLAATHLYERDAATAEKILREGQRQFPEDPMVAGSLAETILTVRPGEPGAFAEAVPLLRQAVAKRPLEQGYRERLAQSLMELGDLKAAEKVLRALTRDWPENPNHWNRLGLTLKRLRKTEEAVGAFEMAVNRGEQVGPARLTFFLNLGKAMLEMADLTDEREKWGRSAWKVFESARAVSESSVDVWIGLAKSIVETDPTGEQIRAAIQLYQKAMAIDPGNFEANLNVALLYYDLWISDPEVESEGKRLAVEHFRRAERKVSREKWPEGARDAFEELVR